MSAVIFTFVPAAQYDLGRQSARRSPNQCHAPVIGWELVTFMCFSTSARAFSPTGFVKITEMGIATPTVAPVCGVIVSSSIGGPAGFDGDGFALAVGFTDPPFPSSELAFGVPPPQALVPASTATMTSAIDIPLRRFTSTPAHNRACLTALLDSGRLPTVAVHM
jgi:hypothetical protein